MYVHTTEEVLNLVKKESNRQDSVALSNPYNLLFHCAYGRCYNVSGSCPYNDATLYTQLFYAQFLKKGFYMRRMTRFIFNLLLHLRLF